ncbi:hypothetical protein CQ012_02340 [Arthrobacter sp. MYb214]|uniref:hypothetical protein n=1 Tax=Arthrobacter sp. MYb214 TaxID=1848596 RepID=UPI000CFD4331|nr:hypothetical protein [Arthrobacter sp. MYb214]PRB78249.1 hypothetical protein CQ012_02340 [Arthrobacter sp. MYb214]
MDYEAAIRQVRVLIADMGTPPLINDPTLQTYLELQDWAEGARWAVKRAAADALEAIAVSEVLVSKKIRTQDLTSDGPAVAESLRKLAAGLRAQADDDDPTLGGTFEIIDAGRSRLEAEEWRVF